MSPVYEPVWDDDGEDRGGQTRFGAALGHVEPSLDLVEHRESFGPLLSELSDRERTMRFFGGLTQTEIGHQVGISQMHVSRLLTRTLA